jgi:hypothetical protein
MNIVFCRLELELMDAVAQSQNALMSQLKDLISNEMGKVQDQQQKYGT